MKNHNLISLAALLLLFLLAGYAILTTSANPYTRQAPAVAEEAGLKEIDFREYEAFKKSIMPQIDQMGDKKIVLLGEGTHGTHEFNKLRYWISRILVEEKGFTHIAFENDYSDAYLLNKGLREKQPLEALMRTHLLRIWQNREVEELLDWMQAFGDKHPGKLHFGGIDHGFVAPDAALISELMLPLNQPELTALASQLQQHSLYQDSIWRKQNEPAFQLDMKALLRNGVDGYQTADQLEQQLAQLELPADKKEIISGFLLDSKLGFNAFYQWATAKTESSRDSCMAEMAHWMVRKPGQKLIIWAHNGHVAKSSIMGGLVGGMGGLLEQKLPGQTFVLGTGTARGSFAAMEDRIIHQQNKLAVYPLDAPLPGSWEAKFDQLSPAAFYAATYTINGDNDTLQHRHIGYNPGSDEGSYDPTNLRDLYDAFLFIRQTTAARFLE